MKYVKLYCKLWPYALSAWACCTASIVIPSLLIVGCQNVSPQNIAIKTEIGTIQSVDTAMKHWKQYVDSGKASGRQIAEVKKAYNAYYTAQLGIKSAVEAFMSSPTAGNSNAVMSSLVTGTAASTAVVTAVNVNAK